MAKEPAADRRTEPGPDHASERAPREPGAAHIRLMLAGDFDSPQQVMASSDLDADKKRQIFEVWIRDLQSRPEAEARHLVQEIREAMAALDHDTAASKR